MNSADAIMMKPLISTIVLLVLLSGLASAATIQGTIYDYSLKPTDAVIRINTTPEQTIVARTGTYKLTVPPGTYALHVAKTTAQGLTERDETTILVTDDGSYTHDFILFQELEEVEEPDIESITQTPPTKPQSNNALWYVILVFIGAGLIIVGIFKLAKKKIAKIEEDTLEEALLAHIKEQKRTTQKELRKAFPYAEATISLALTALEHQGKIEKVKKGRGNVLLYKK